MVVPDGYHQEGGSAEVGTTPLPASSTGFFFFFLVLWVPLPRASTRIALPLIAIKTAKTTDARRTNAVFYLYLNRASDVVGFVL